MEFLSKIIKKFTSRNGGNNQEVVEEQDCKVLEEIDNTMIDSNRRIEKMYKEIRAG